jgi:hypothetical protein
MPYPDQYQILHNLVTVHHAALTDELLLVAIYYASKEWPYEECLFEVARHFGFDEIDPERRIFTIQFSGSVELPIPPPHHLRLLLTNPAELERAMSERWPQIDDLLSAINVGEYKVLYKRPDDLEATDILAELTNAVIAA